MQRQSFNKIKLFFIIITEHISFIPDNILNNSQIISIPRPSLGYYNKCVNSMRPNKNVHMYASPAASSAIKPIYIEHGESDCNSNSDGNSDGGEGDGEVQYYKSPSCIKNSKHTSIASTSNPEFISVFDNYKNLTSMSNIKNVIVNTNELTNPHECICNNIIESIQNPETINYLRFRDILYEILIYDLDINECIWYILSCLIKMEVLNKDNIADVLLKTFIFLQYYNNNYRPIYHLENYMYNLITIINGYKTCH